MAGLFTDYACCAHCQHETDGGPPHEDPCPEKGCTAGQAVISHPDAPAPSVHRQARDDAARMWRDAFGTEP